VIHSSVVRTISGLPLRLVRADACCIDVFATAYSSTKLARWRAVEEVARDLNDLVRVGPVGLEPTTYGIQVDAAHRSALLVTSALRLGRMG